MMPASALITGGTGWLGKQTASRLIQKFGYDLNLVLTSSKSTDLTIRDKCFKTIQSSQIDLQKDIDYLFDYAFLTREKIDLLGSKAYFNTNSDLINNSTEIIKRFKPKVVILASSGAIYNSSKFSDAKNHKLYADLKLLQEKCIKEACNESGSRLIIVRIFNLSGLGVTKESNYAIVDLTLKAMRNLDLTTSSNRKVTRRYCDLTQLLKLLVEMGKLNLNCTFDSGGVKMDLRTLSYKITEVIETKSKVLFPDLYENLEADNYFSDSDNYEKLLLELLGIESMSIENQIHNTRTALLSKL